MIRNATRVLRTAGKPGSAMERRIDVAWANRRVLRAATAVKEAKTPQDLDQFLIVN